MEDRNCEKTQYTCGVCGTSYDFVQERMNCEMVCLKKKQEEERKAAEEKKRAEKETRYAEVVEALKNASELLKAYTKDYGPFEYDSNFEFIWPSRLFHHFW